MRFRLHPPAPTARLGRTMVVAMLVAMIGFAPAVASAQTTAPRGVFNVVPITITGVTIQDGGLVASGIVGGNTFSTPIAVSVAPGPTVAAACPILNLQLAPIHLNLLGLVVDTSSICLDVTANSGQGLLGDLLCGIANLLQGGTPLSTILGGLTAAEQTRLNAGLTSLLNQGVFTPITSSLALAGASCNILNLALGPIDLNLLGLRVELDNCADPPGPVTVDITANPAGGLLGSLLCGLANLLNDPLRAPFVLRIIAWVIGVLSA